MSNFDKAVSLLRYADLPGRTLHPRQVEAIVTVLQTAGSLAPDVQVITTSEELDAFACEDPAALVLASRAGMVRTAGSLWGEYRLGSMWGLPAVVIASGAQVRDAREAMEIDNE